jgi:hypothetical protein
LIIRSDGKRGAYEDWIFKDPRKIFRSATHDVSV